MPIHFPKNLQETTALGKSLAKKLKGGDVLCLEGELGAGKTTLAQAIGHALGITRIVSPTYIIMREYPVATHPTIKKLYHLDFYRLSDALESKSFDLGEVISDPAGLVIIEWPDRIHTQLPQNRTTIHITALPDNSRKITINP